MTNFDPAGSLTFQPNTDPEDRVPWSPFGQGLKAFLDYKEFVESNAPGHANFKCPYSEDDPDDTMWNEGWHQGYMNTLSDENRREWLAWITERPVPALGYFHKKSGKFILSPRS